MQPDVPEGHHGGPHGLMCSKPLSSIRGQNTETTSSTIQPEAEKEKECGRLGEVVAVIHVLSKLVSRLPPFLPITLEEMLQQGKEDIAVCLLILVSGKSLAQNYVDFLFKSVLNL